MSTAAVNAMCSLAGTPILAMRIKTPLGFYSVEACGDGVHSVHRENNTGTKGPTPIPDFSVNVLKSNPVNAKNGSVSAKDPALTLKKVVDWFHLFFTDLPEQERTFPKPFAICTPSATDLQKTIWEALQTNVRSGKTISYGDLAKLAQRPNAARAVGSAMRKNPNVLIVPCHRVVRANEEIGNYSGGGSEMKKWLLEHEKHQMTKSMDGEQVASP